MKIDISAVVRTVGAELKINESGIVDDLKDVFGTISVVGPVVFSGTLTNMDGLLQLQGEATCTYETQCDRCTKPITRNHRLQIVEELVERLPGYEDTTDEEHFTYQGNLLVLDKILSDNIILTLPMYHRCEQDCNIICPECGEPVTGNGCGCTNDQPIDPRLAAFKDLLVNQHADEAE